MSDTMIASLPAKRRRRWLRWLAWSLSFVLVLLVALYFVATSSAFLKAVILPRASDALNASLTVSDIALRPFSQIVLRDLKVQANGQPPLLAATEVRVNYHLLDILGGNLHLNEIAVVSPKVELIENVDGSHNWDPILKALRAKPAAERKPVTTEASKPLQLDLGKLILSDATILQTKHYADGRSDQTVMTNVNLTLTNVKNGQTAKIELGADLRLESSRATNASSRLAAALKGSFICALTSDLKPGVISGGLSFAVSEAGGQFSDLLGFSAALDCDVSPMEIKQLALNFQKAGAPLGALSVTGPFDANKMEGKLGVALLGIDRRLLNLIGEKSGLNFGTTRIDSTNEIELAKSGAIITARGKFALEQVQLTRAGQTTPTLDLSAAYDVTVDRNAQVVMLRALNLTGTQNRVPLVSAQLASPMNLAWGGSSNGLGDAALDLTVTGLNLADWKPFIGNQATAGNVGLKLKVSSHQGGKQIGFEVNADVANLDVQVGSNQISQVGITLVAHGQAAELKQVALSDCQLKVVIQDDLALTVSGSANYDLASGDADAQVRLQAALARLLQTLPQPNLSISSGNVELNARVTRKQKTQTINGDLVLTNFNGQIGANQFLGYASQLKLSVTNSPELIQINPVAGSFSQNGKSGGAFDLAGTYNPAQKSADLKLNISGLNENALRPLVEPLPGDKRLASVSISGMFSGQYNPQAGSALKADVQVANLVVNDPRQPLPATTLAVGLQLDVSLNQQTADVRQLQIALTPTALAANQLQFSGKVDFSKTKEIQGQLKLAADSLDLTHYYDLFAGGTNATAKSAAAPATTSANADQEPAAVTLPLRDFTFAVDIARIYLHEVAISNFLTTVKANGGHILMKPFQLALNGAPVSATADVDLGVRGYLYKVGFDAQNIPLAPLVNTFQPARAGQLGGAITAAAQINGAGITGTSLQKNLAGNVSVNMTNLHLSVVNVHSAILKSVINVIATIPELVSNPANAIATLLGGATGQGGLIQELEKSPIDVIAMQATAGDGRINLQTATVQSSAFKADGSGAVMLAAVLTNSAINIPVNVALSQAIATRLKLTATAGSTNATYAALPQFLTMSGTIGKPQANIDKLALVGAAARSIGESMLNPSGTNATPIGNLLNQFLQPRK